MVQAQLLKWDEVGHPTVLRPNLQISFKVTIPTRTLSQGNPNLNYRCGFVQGQQGISTHPWPVSLLSWCFDGSAIPAGFEAASAASVRGLCKGFARVLQGFCKGSGAKMSLLCVLHGSNLHHARVPQRLESFGLRNSCFNADESMQAGYVQTSWYNCKAAFWKFTL